MMIRITLTSTVEEALQALAMTDQAGVVVWDRAAPVGVVTLDDVSDVGDRRPPPEALVEDVMSHECVSIDPAADEPETHHLYVDAAWTSLLRRRPQSPEALRRRSAVAAARDLRPPTEVRSDLQPEVPPSVRCS